MIVIQDIASILDLKVANENQATGHGAVVTITYRALELELSLGKHRSITYHAKSLEGVDEMKRRIDVAKRSVRSSN